VVWFTFVEDATRLEEQASILDLAGTKAAIASSYIQRFFVELAVSSYALNRAAGDPDYMAGIARASALNQGPMLDGTEDELGFILNEEKAQSQVPGWRRVCLHPASKCASKTAYFTTAASGWFLSSDKATGGTVRRSSAASVKYHTAVGSVRPLPAEGELTYNRSSAMDPAWLALYVTLLLFLPLQPDPTSSASLPHDSSHSTTSSTATTRQAAQHGRSASDESCWSAKGGCGCIQNYAGFNNGLWREMEARTGGWASDWQSSEANGGEGHGKVGHFVLPPPPRVRLGGFRNLTPSALSLACPHHCPHPRQTMRLA
jgi:hypothetical protein